MKRMQKFFVLCLGLVFVGPLRSMSEREKVCALADIWKNKNNWSIKKEEYDQGLKLPGSSSHDWEVYLLAKEWEYVGIKLYENNGIGVEELVGKVEDFYASFGAYIIKIYDCFRNNKYFTILPVVLDRKDKKLIEHIRLYLFQFPLDLKEDKTLTFVADLGEFSNVKECAISYDSSKILVYSKDKINKKHLLNIITVKVPEELIFKEKKCPKINFDA